MTPQERLLYSQRIDSPAKQQIELLQCAKDVVHWVNHWVWTYDPRLINSGGMADVPMVLWTDQDKFLYWLRDRESNRENGICEKSRDYGATYLASCHALHGFLFRPGFRCGFGSLTKEEVDKKGDMKSIFERLRFILRRLPRWMLPKSWNWLTCASDRRLTNYDMSSSVTGDVGENIGRGDRTTMYFVDESAHLPNAERMDSDLAATTDCRIDISTPFGMNHFAQKRFSGNFPVFTFHWSKDPRKQETRISETGEVINVFKEKKIKEIGIVQWNQEYDLDYAGSVEGLAIPPEWVRAAINLELKESDVNTGGLDIAEEGNDKSVLVHRRGPRVCTILDWGKCTTHDTAYRAADECIKLRIGTLHFDTIGVGTGPKGIWQAKEATKTLGFYANPVNVGETPNENVYWPDGMSSKEKFVNLKAELWWKVRTRFEKTYEFVTQRIAHPHEELISIPNHPQLISELSMPKYERIENGKIRIESKEKMRARGLKSPDFAEALILAYIEPMENFTVLPVTRADSPLVGMPAGVGMVRPDSYTAQFQQEPSVGGSAIDSPDYLGFRS